MSQPSRSLCDPSARALGLGAPVHPTARPDVPGSPAITVPTPCASCTHLPRGDFVFIDITLS